MEKFGKPKLIRKINSDLILEFIRQKQITTKTEFYDLCDPSKQAINNIVALLFSSC